MGEFRTFARFLHAMWADAAAVSMLFPLSNAVMEVLPLARSPAGAFAVLSPALVTLMATLVSLVQLVWVFTQRDDLGAVSHARVRSRAARSLALAALALTGYLVGCQVLSGDAYFDLLDWHRADPRRLVGDIGLASSYAAVFGATTRGFTLLGLLEFARQLDVQGRGAGSPRRSPSRPLAPR